MGGDISLLIFHYFPSIFLLLFYIGLFQETGDASSIMKSLRLGEAGSSSSTTTDPDPSNSTAAGSASGSAATSSSTAGARRSV